MLMVRGGGHNKFWGGLITLELDVSAIRGAKVSTLLKGAQNVSDLRFSHFVAAHRRD